MLSRFFQVDDQFKMPCEVYRLTARQVYRVQTATKGLNGLSQKFVHRVAWPLVGLTSL